ncbi:MAG: hypothetical protein RI947_1269 [Candidatus Parcubacteria bacterium]|jgi:hypothetical protein
MPPPDWTLSSQKNFPKADHSLPIEERLAILETAVIEILIGCDICQQGLWYGTQCPELSHRILVIALNQSYPAIPLHKSFVETVKRRTPRPKKQSVSPRWIDTYRKLWGLDWKAAHALIEQGLTPRKAYNATAEDLARTHHIKPDVVVRILAVREPREVSDLMEEGRLRFPDLRSLLLAAVTVKGLGEEMPIEVTYEEQSSLVAPAYVREPLCKRLDARGIVYTQEVPPVTPAVPVGT